jgi:pyruvate kinase
MFAKKLSLTRIISKKAFGVSQIRSLSLLDTATSLSNDKSYTSPSLTKIVATIGPTSEQYPVLKTLVTAGLRIMRINFSHATYEEADLRMTNLRKSPGLGQIKNKADFNLRAVLLDTQGPEIRTGSFPSGKNIDFTTNDKVTLTTDDRVRSNQSKDTLWISYKSLFETISTDTKILLDDGAIELSIDSFNKGTCEVFCTVVNSGTLGNKKGVNLPGEKVLLPAMSEKDKEDIKWGIENDIDYIAASFVRKPSDVTEIRDYVKTLLPIYQPENYPVPLIISKIESVESLLNFDEILKVSDGIMVARGDLGVEIPMETLTMVQKEIVRKSNLAGNQFKL